MTQQLNCFTADPMSGDGFPMSSIPRSPVASAWPLRISSLWRGLLWAGICV